MRCTRPRTVGFLADGKTISWSQKYFSKEYPTFQLPCAKCLECRLDYARQWAVRCVHEAQMHEQNSFVTLTYDDKNLKDPKLDYRDFQLFMKRLRKVQNEPIGFFATGEYGEKTKRKHWHALLFNWRPSDTVHFRTNERGDKIYRSDVLNSLWGLGFTEIGSVSFESAGYCARYAAKKIVHTANNKIAECEDHEYQPISKKSSKQAIGKKWLEAYWTDVFPHGRIVMRDGTEIGVPRYYEKWLKKNHPEAWTRYVTENKFFNIQKMEFDAQKKKDQRQEVLDKRTLAGKPNHNVKTENQVREIIQNKNFELLQSYLKL